MRRPGFANEVKPYTSNKFSPRSAVFAEHDSEVGKFPAEFFLKGDTYVSVPRCQNFDDKKGTGKCLSSITEKAQLVLKSKK